MFSRKLPGAVAAALIALGAGASAAQAQGPPIRVINPANAGPGTLRNAINQANAQAGRSVIEFALPAAGTVITPANDLPMLTAPVLVDGYSQPGAMVLIDAVNTTRALQLATDDSVIRGLAVHDSSGAAAADGIQVGGDGNVIEGNHIGTDAAGATLGFWNLTTGVTITGDENVVGGNLIAEVGGDGVSIIGNESVVKGNRLGLVKGGGGLGNAANGLSITGDRNEVVGRNLLTGNNGDGVAIAGDASSSTARATP